MPEIGSWVPVPGISPKPNLGVFVIIAITQLSGTTSPLRIIKIESPPCLAEIRPTIIILPLCSVWDYTLLATLRATLCNRFESNILPDLEKIISGNWRIRSRTNQQSDHNRRRLKHPVAHPVAEGVCSKKVFLRRIGKETTCIKRQSPMPYPLVQNRRQHFSLKILVIRKYAIGASVDNKQLILIKRKALRESNRSIIHRHDFNNHLSLVGNSSNIGDFVCKPVDAKEIRVRNIEKHSTFSHVNISIHRRGDNPHHWLTTDRVVTQNTANRAIPLLHKDIIKININNLISPTSSTTVGTKRNGMTAGFQRQDETCRPPTGIPTIADSNERVIRVTTIAYSINLQNRLAELTGFQGVRINQPISEINLNRCRGRNRKALGKSSRGGMRSGNEPVVQTPDSNPKPRTRKPSSRIERASRIFRLSRSKHVIREYKPSRGSTAPLKT